MPTVGGKEYECDSCGACCKRLIIEIENYDLVREPRLLPMVTPIKGFPRGEPEPDEENLLPGYEDGAMLACGSPCQALQEDNRCSIYSTRPTVCVVFMAGSEQCQDARESQGLGRLEPRTKPCTD